MSIRDHVKSVIKAFTWRTVGAADTFCLGWLVTGDHRAAGAIMGLEVLTKSFLYYAHERAWSIEYLTNLFSERRLVAS